MYEKQNVKVSWFQLSLAEQMVNIGNEVKRAIRFDDHQEKKKPFLEKAIRYNELSMMDPKNAPCLPELQIGKMVLEDYLGAHELNYTKEQIRDYYLSYRNLL